jgi:hypothetical protein
MTAAPPIVPDAALFERVLGADWSRLHPTLQRFHSLRGRHELHGEVLTEPAAGALGRCLGWLMRLPRTAQSGALRFTLEAQPARERWTRHFPHTTMSSTMKQRGAWIVERIGPVSFHFTLAARQGTLALEYRQMRVLGLPWPRRLAPAIDAREHGEGDRLCFDVEARLPAIGRVVRYSGWLTVAPAA